MTAQLIRQIVAVTGAFLAFSSSAVELSYKAKGEFFLSQTEPADRVSKNWLNGGTGQLHYSVQPLSAGPQYLTIDLLTDSAFSARLNSQWHASPEAGFSVTEAWLGWSPLPVNGYRIRGRLGYFYPQLSLENTDMAWTSPYSSTFSAINSWVAEEVRTRGGELVISRPGRFFQTNHSWSGVIGAFQGNDPAGTLLAWRGFALHNLQTGIGERVNFADYPSLQTGDLSLQNSWVEPTRELDHRSGYYLGLHWEYGQKTRLRAYYYDNNGDPLLFSHQQYAWRTRFSSLAAQHRINDNWQLVAQWLTGNTLMGPAAVDADYSAWFLLAHWQQGKLSATLRYDDFKVDDKDLTEGDDNNGNGEAILLALGYQFNNRLRLSAEHVRLNSTQLNRQQWDWQIKQQQSLSKLILSWRWQ
ncbi:hypothetical protein [Arsukibacterium sp. UBA3155]|uniref:hypothetical protein n=1 Tax=Arsukibacterium sp. UBA3155 TaxID=1946058 RepID=UPI0025C238E7|nr:hypothetical protein [Arsukibacterium sp. UBA3155]|tara:strand:+ start:64649 stop:65887 length:1239 start_codon:yes stop_codon:yes gene_type:complete